MHDNFLILQSLTDFPVIAGADRFVFGMIEDQASQQPDKERDRQEKAAARQKLLEERAAARQQRVEVRLLANSYRQR